MRARFQRDVGRRAACAFASLAQCEHLGMGLAGSLMPALPQHFFASGDDAPNTRIRLRSVKTLFGQAQGASHVHRVDGMEGVWTSIHGARSVRDHAAFVASRTAGVGLASCSFR